MASAGSTVRKDLHDLTKPMEVRELNRQLEWLWKQLLGGLNDKSFSSGGLTKVTTVAENKIVESITSGTVETDSLYAALSELMVAKIGVANIDYAHIVDFFNERLFTDVGTAGEFRAEKLVVNRAQINDLEVGAFRLVATDGKVYKIDVDENGTLTTEYLYDQEEWFENGQAPQGYSPVATSFTVDDITTGTLYVTGEASFMKVFGKYLEFDEGHITSLFSTNGAIDILKTYDIRNDDKITLTVGGVRQMILQATEAGIKFGRNSSDYNILIDDDSIDFLQTGALIARLAADLLWAKALSADRYVKIGGATLEWSETTGFSLDV